MKETITYRNFYNLPIHLDIHTPASATESNPVPILVWYHGGGLLQGSRQRYAAHFDRLANELDTAFITVDYRLAPQTPFHDILSDVGQSVAYIIEELPNRIGPIIDVGRWAVCGSSAGGWLSLLVGLGVANPKHIPKACTAIYPITNTLDLFWITQHDKAAWESEPVQLDTVKEHLDRNAPAVADNAENSARSKMYAWMVQSGTLNELLYGENTEEASKYIIKNILKDKKKEELPPVYITHGTMDTAVPFTQAVEVVEALQKKDATVVFDVAHDKDHLWDEQDEHERMDGLYAFVKQHL